MKKMNPLARLSGTTERYEGNGRMLGYPTANINATTNLGEGVYFGFANLGEYKNYPALVFVGTPTTVGSNIHRVEAHLLDITDKDFYGKTLALTVLVFHRANQHFKSVELLVEAMKKDEVAARQWFSKIENTSE